MKDNKDKKVIFSDTHIRHAQLKIRLEYDGLSQAEFFRSIITGYLAKDTDLLSYINKYKETNQTQSKRNLKYVSKDYEKANELLGQFGIGDSELEDIFDIIAEDHPDL